MSLDTSRASNVCDPDPAMHLSEAGVGRMMARREARGEWADACAKSATNSETDELK
jgi:hypothetical protein